jgi:Domain of unknown function (DUF4345)
MLEKPMHVIDLLTNIGAAITLALGVLGLVSPTSAAKLVGIKPDGVLGVSEIRATYGGFFIGLGLGCLWLQAPQAFLVAALAWIGAACARLLSVVLDRSLSVKNMGGIVLEAGIGALLLIGSV